MIHSHRNIIYRTSAALIAAVTAIATSNAAAIHTFPGVAPCDTTLQRCIDNAAAGDTLQLATNTLIDEFVAVDKSLVIEAAAGFSPLLSSARATANTTDNDVTVRGITFTFALFAGLEAGGGKLTFRAINNVITASRRGAIEVSTLGGSAAGKVTTIISGNSITQTPDFGVCADAISVLISRADMEATIAGNTIAANNIAQCSAISVVSVGPASGNILIDRNRIAGFDFNDGITLINQGNNLASGEPPGTLTARVSNNLVTGQTGRSGSPASLLILASGDNSVVSAQVINNTISNGRDGVSVLARTDLGARVNVGFHNNIVAFMSGSGLSVDDNLPGFVNSNNLLFSTNFDRFTAGPGTLTVDPRFVNAALGDYSLTADSEAIDRGLDSALPAEFTTDLAGNSRRVSTIDIGAFESIVPRAVALAASVPTLMNYLLCALSMLIVLVAAYAYSLQRQRDR
jgi:hypothetical protein